MITCFFGVPGVGKSTFLSKLAIRELNRIKKGKSRYDHVLTNFPVEGCEKVDFSDLGVYDIKHCYILLDEITLDADNRDYKNFSNHSRDFFILHRHAFNDIVFFTQQYDAVDKKIRNLVYDLWYLTCSVVPGIRRFTFAKRIYRNMKINEYSSELVLGYRFAKRLEALFSPSIKICYRPFYYKYFDSFDLLQLSDLPPFKYERW